jgi:lipopolysaccharide transport system permease protein
MTNSNLKKIPFFQSLWGFRGFMFGSVKREFQAKYKNSLLGFLFPFLNPLTQITIYTLVFSRIMSSKLGANDNAYSYSIYLCVGIIFWSFFAETTLKAVNVFLDNANLIKKINFPKICLPIMVVLNASINFFIIFAIFLIFLVLSNSFPGLCIIGVIPLLIIQIIFAMGIGMTLAVINIFFRDIGHIYTIGLQFWFWLTPIVYYEDILPQKVAALIQFNPLTQLFTAYHTIFVSHQWPNWIELVPILLIGIFMIFLSISLYKKHYSDLVDQL